MSGIYLHIPFCRKACHYCNFHFSTSLRLKDEMIAAICMEIGMRKNYLSNSHLTSIYFGGGTPSLLNDADLELIFKTISKHFSWDEMTEITLEANPDDINPATLSTFKKWEINRLSIGVQSFFDEDLKWMNRAHNAGEAERCIKAAQDAGFANLTIDLIYGSPTTTMEMWKKNISTTLSFDIPHISSYCMTVEEKTALFHQIKTQQSIAPDPEKSANQFDMLVSNLVSHGYEHYEISNFGKPGHHAIHNTNYWRGAEYLGIGPSAHSFDSKTRSWNIPNNKKYIDGILASTPVTEVEILSDATKYNEYIMTGLRTMWGVNTLKIQSFGPEKAAYFNKMVIKEVAGGYINKIENDFMLTALGKHFADRIAMNLFFIDE